MSQKSLVALCLLLGAGPLSTGPVAGAPATPLRSPDRGAAFVPAGLQPSDWGSIRAAYEANRHRVFAIESGHRARNPRQEWLTTFDGRGFATTPDSSKWSWGLELRSYGFAGEEQVVRGTSEVKVDGQRVTYRWSPALEEWFVNDGRGLEHGFTVHERPAASGRADAPLQFDLAVRGGLRPEVSSDAESIRFVDEQGAPAVTYDGLKVWDADGKVLRAYFSSEWEGVRIVVDERGARYPITVDPIAQQALLTASNAEADDTFGWSVGISGDTVVASAVNEYSNATGVNGDQSNNSAVDAGAAYVFVRTGASWTQQAYLKASNTQAGDFFGSSVAISGDTIVVTALGEDSAATGVNGDQSSNAAADSGAAYVFVRTGTTWTQQAYLKASNTVAGDELGNADHGGVAISGDTIVIGAMESETDTVTNAGAAFVFVRSGTTWSEQALLRASNPGTNDLFGADVAVSGDTIIAGASQEDSDAAGVNGDQSNNNAGNSGAAYVFVRDGATWSQQAYLKSSSPSSGDDLFGSSVAIFADTAVVGAIGEDSNATGINGDQSDNSALGAGAVYIFIRNGATWSQQAYVKASNSAADDFFGRVVAIDNELVVVGAAEEDSNATTVDGDQANNNATNAGAAYLFQRAGATWAQIAYLKGAVLEAGDRMGRAVAISGQTAVVGAPFMDSFRGGVYVFSPPEIAVEQPPGTDLVDGISNIDFGGAYLGVSAAAKTFTIKNVGAGNLTGIAVTKDGAASADFAVDTTGMSNSVAAGASTTFTVTFTPSGVGTRSARLLIASDDADENPFEIALIGTGIEPPVIHFTASSYSASENLDAFGGRNARLTVTRDGDISGSSTVRYSTADGSATAGADYTAASGTPFTFGADVRSADIVVPIVDDSTVEGTESFTVTLSDPSSATLGTPATATVDIADNDAAPSPSPSPTPTPSATPTPSPSPSPSASPSPSPSPSPEATPAQPINISTRVNVGTGNNVMIGGFIITGDAPKKVIVRGIGASSEVDGALEDPVLELHGPAGFITITNNNWEETQKQEIEDTGIAPEDPRESAIVETLPPGAYTAIVRGNGNTTGVGVVEVYDLSLGAPSQLANISTRGFVETGDNVIIGGFILGGNAGDEVRVIVRAIGPSLQATGISNALADPALDIRNKDGNRIAFNDNWQDDGQAAQVTKNEVEPESPLESALYLALPPGEYTAIVSGAGGSVGVGLVEIYNLP